MPEHKTHLVIGLLVYLACMYLLLFFGPIAWPRKGELLAYTLIGALFPDIDTKSKIQRMIYVAFLLLLLFLAYARQYSAATAVGVLACLPLIVRHRGLFHSRLFLGALGAIAVGGTYLYTPSYTGIMACNVIFFLTGAFSHLIADRRIRW